MAKYLNDIDVEGKLEVSETGYFGGNVGIGTSSPTQKLSITSSLNYEGLLLNGSNAPNVCFARYSSTSSQWKIGIAGSIGTSFSISKGDSNDEKFVISDSGDIGIGTYTPNEKLQVVGSAQFGTDSGDRILISNRANNDMAIESFASELFLSSGYNGMSFEGSANTTLMKLTDSGNVGIGTTSPSEKLTVYSTSSENDDEFVIVAGKANGTSRFTGIGLSGYIAADGAVKAGIVLERSSSYGVGSLHILNNNTADNSNATISDSKLTVLSNGNVGIGTTSPNVKLHVVSSDETVFRIERNAGSGFTVLDIKDGVGTSGNSVIRFSDTTASGRGELNYEHSDDSLRISTAGSESMRILNNGNVGIGTTSPNSKLDVRNSSSGIALELIQTSGNADDFIDLKMIAGNSGSGTLGTILRHKRDGTGGGDFSILTNPSLTGTPTEKLIVKADGNVGIGTDSPSEKLEVEGNILINGGAPYVSLKTTQTGTPDWKIYNSYNSVGDFAIIGGSSVGNKFNIQPNGNVGIGTTNPSQKLEVDGNVNVGGHLYIETAEDITTPPVLLALNSSRVRGVTPSNLKTTLGLDNVAYTNVNNNFSVGQNITGDLDVTGNIKSEGAIIGNDSTTYDLIVKSNAPIIRMEDSTLGTVHSLVSNNSELRVIADQSLSLRTNNIARYDIDVNGNHDFKTGNATFGGNVGIGIVTPSIIGGTAKLTVDAGNAPVSIVNGTTDGMYIRRFGNSGSYQLQTTSGNGNSGTLSLQSYGGNVGIGTTSPSAKLDVTDFVDGNETYINAGLSATNPTRFKVYNESYKGALSLYDDGNTEDVKITTGGASWFNGGNVGIGTTSPAKTLDVNGDVYINSNYQSTAAASDLTIGKVNTGDHGITIVTSNANTAGIFFGDNDHSDAGRIRYQHSNNTMRFDTNRTEAMRIDSSGNVGIGTTSPDAKLEVVGSVDLGSSGYQIKTSTSVGNNSAIIYRKDSGGNLEFRAAPVDYNQLFLENGGNVGIGTSSPNSKLDVDGGIRMADDSTTASSSNVGTQRYRTSGNNSYVDMCMQTGAATYAWINIVQNNW